MEKQQKKVVKGTDIEKYCSDYIYEARNEDFTEWTPQDAMVIISYDIKKYMKDKNINKTEASKQLFKIHNKIWKEIKSIVGQIDGVIASSGQSQMISMDNAIIQLYKEGVISKKTAIEYSQNRDLMIKKIGML